jgi:hypothetical protein
MFLLCHLPFVRSGSIFAATVLLPRDDALQGQDGWSLQASDIYGTRVALYNMIPGAFCPEELATAGNKNSMLGAVEQRELPIFFSRGTDGAIRATGLSGPTIRIVNTIVECNYVVLVTDGTILPGDGGSSGPYTLPAALPTFPDRQVVCRPPVFNATADGTYVMSDGGGGATAGGGNNNKSSTAAMVVGVSVGVGLGLVCIIGLCVFFFTRRARGRRAGLKGMPVRSQELSDTQAPPHSKSFASSPGECSGMHLYIPQSMYMYSQMYKLFGHLNVPSCLVQWWQSIN